MATNGAFVESIDDGAYNPEEPGQAGGALKRSRLRALVQDFQPIWFTWCMNSGILGILMHQYSYQFHGLAVLSDIALVLDLALFLVASTLFLLRLAVFGRQAYYELVNDVSTLGLLATWPIAWLTLVSLVVLSISSSYWGGYAWTMTAYVMWWIGAAWMIVMLYFVFWHVIARQSQRQDNNPLSPFLLIAAVGVATVGTIGGLLCTYSNGLSPSEAVPVIIFSFCAVGVALFMALILYSYHFHQLLKEGFPAPEDLGLMFLFTGPMGQTATALQMLGSAADVQGRFAGVEQGTFITRMAAAPLDTACVLLALMISGMGTIWLLFAFVAVLDSTFRGKLMWGPSWNAVIFPTGTLTTSFLELAVELNSTFFRVISGVLIVFLVIVFFINVAFTIWKVYRGELLIVREDWRKKRQ